ncbi:MAG: hypothetical protein ABI167_03985 [Nitrosospira sp.]
MSPCRNDRQRRPARASHEPWSSPASRQKSYLSVNPRDILALSAFTHFSPDLGLPLPAFYFLLAVTPFSKQNGPVAIKLQAIN